MPEALHPPIAAATRAILESPQLLLIGGQWCAAVSGATLATHDPATGARLAEVALGDARDIDLAVAAARRAFEGPWSRLSGFERARLLRKLAQLIEANATALAELDVLDNRMHAPHRHKIPPSP